MSSERQEQYETSRVNYIKTRSASADSGFGNEEVINKTDIQTALEKIKKGKRKFEKWQKKSSVDIRNIRDEEGSNILHLIARLKKKQKCRSLNFLIERISEEDLAKLVDSKNKEEKTPLQVALIDKIKKGKHGSHTVQSNNNTLKFLVTLLEHGAKPDQLELETLQGLDEKQNEYYRKFLEKLAESIKKPELKSESEIEAKIKEIIPYTINTPDSSGNYLLHSVIKNNYKGLFEKLLQKGADVSLKDANGNNALHLITKLRKKRKLEFLNAVLNISKWEGKELLKEQFIKAVNDQNNKSGDSKNSSGQTPLHQLLQHIKEKSEAQSCTDRKFEKTNRYRTLELLLRNGADITAQDKEGNNALHYIASLKGEQKVTCLKLISSLVEKGSVPKEKLSEAISATNKEEQAPLQVALIKKAEKGEHLSQKNTIFDPAINYDNTTKFCAKLLQNGANPDSLDLKDEKFHTDNYYLVLRDLKDYRKTPHTVQEKARETKEQLEKKYNIKTFSGQLQSTAQSVGSSIKEVASNTGKALSAVAKYIDPASRTRELLAITITVTVIAMAAFAFFQGQVEIGAAIPIIAVAGVICLTLTLGFSGIKKLFENSTNEVKNLIDNDQQESPDQPEHKNPPNSLMSDTQSEPHKKPQDVQRN